MYMYICKNVYILVYICIYICTCMHKNISMYRYTTIKP